MTRVELNAKLHEQLKKENQQAFANNLQVCNVGSFHERLFNINLKYFQEKNLQFYKSEQFERPYVGKFSKDHLFYEELKYELRRLQSNLNEIINLKIEQSNNDVLKIKKDDKSIILNEQKNIDFANNLLNARSKYFDQTKQYYEKMISIGTIYSPIELSRIQQELEENDIDFEQSYSEVQKNINSLQQQVTLNSKAHHRKKIFVISIYSMIVLIVLILITGLVLFFI